jgi:hypothetical protein
MLHALCFIKAHALTWPKEYVACYGLVGKAAKNSYIIDSGTTNRGIGFAFAEELVRAGFSIILIGRGQERL